MPKPVDTVNGNALIQPDSHERQKELIPMTAGQEIKTTFLSLVCRVSGEKKASSLLCLIIFAAELKMEILREREMREGLEKQMLEEQRARGKLIFLDFFFLSVLYRRWNSICCRPTTSF